MKQDLLRSFGIIFLLTSIVFIPRVFAAVDTAASVTSTTVDQEQVERLPIHATTNILPARFVFVIKTNRNFERIIG